MFNKRKGSDEKMEKMKIGEHSEYNEMNTGKKKEGGKVIK